MMHALFFCGIFGTEGNGCAGIVSGSEYKIWYNMGNVVIGGGLYESEIGHYRR